VNLDLLQTLIERWGFPVAFSVWLMITFTRELREMRVELQRLVVLLAVIAKTLDVPGSGLPALGMQTTPEEGK
jgi:hypothetical protein